MGKTNFIVTPFGQYSTAPSLHFSRRAILNRYYAGVLNNWSYNPHAINWGQYRVARMEKGHVVGRIAGDLREHCLGQTSHASDILLASPLRGHPFSSADGEGKNSNRGQGCCRGAALFNVQGLVKCRAY